MRCWLALRTQSTATWHGKNEHDFFGGGHSGASVVLNALIAVVIGGSEILRICRHCVDHLAHTTYSVYIPQGHHAHTVHTHRWYTPTLYIHCTLPLNSIHTSVPYTMYPLLATRLLVTIMWVCDTLPPHQDPHSDYKGRHWSCQHPSSGRRDQKDCT